MELSHVFMLLPSHASLRKTEITMSFARMLKQGDQDLLLDERIEKTHYATG